MELLALANAKGGTCKTTLAVNLGAAWAEAGLRVLLVDLDPQASATDWLGPSAEEGKPFAQALIEEANGGGGGIDAGDLIEPTRLQGLHRIPAGRWLGTAERELRAVAGEPLVLRQLLARLPAGRWDTVLLDCPPSQQDLTANALAAASHLIIPIEAAPMAMRPVKALMERVGRIQAGVNRDLQVLALVVCRYKRTLVARDVLASLHERYGELVTTATVRESTRVSEAPSHGLPIIEYDPAGGAAEDFRVLASELRVRLDRRLARVG